MSDEEVPITLEQAIDALEAKDWSTVHTFEDQLDQNLAKSLLAAEEHLNQQGFSSE